MDTARRANIFVKTAAVLIASLGFAAIGLVVSPFFRNLSWHDLWILIFMIPVILFGCYCIFTAYKSLQTVSAQNVRRISVITAILITVLFLAPFDNILRKSARASLAVPIMMIFAGVLYFICNKLFFKFLGMPAEINWEKREKASKSFFAMLAFFLFSDLSRIIVDWAPKKPGHEHLPMQPWFPILGLLVPLILAILLYKIALRIYLYGKPKAENLATPA